VKPDKDHLLALILRHEPPLPARPAQADAALSELLEPSPREPPPAQRFQARAQARAEFRAWLRELERHLPPPSDSELDEYYRYALMGVVVGFGDRNLSPYLPQHTAMLAPLLEDIRAVYERIKSSAAPYSVEEFIFRAYDYGIHKAYYLDWDLYLSHDMY
jgi:hypothetical protein